MFFICDGKVSCAPEDEARYSEVCPTCRAVGYGNATCSACVRQWPRFGHRQEWVDQLLAAIGDQAPVPPFGTPIH